MRTAATASEKGQAMNPLGLNRSIRNAGAVTPHVGTIAVLLLIILTAGACTFEVQPIEEYTSADGYLHLRFPASWDVLDEDAMDGASTVLLGTNPDLIDMDVVPPGEAGVAVMLTPDFVPGLGGVDMPLTAQELADIMRTNALTEQPDVGEVEAVTLSDGTDAYRFAAPSPEADMTLYTFAPSEQTLAMLAFIGAPGEANAERMAEAEEILNSVQFRGDPEEYVEGIRAEMGGMGQ